MNKNLNDLISFANAISNKDVDSNGVEKICNKYLNIDYDNIVTRLPWCILMQSAKTCYTSLNIKTEGMHGIQVVQLCVSECPEIFGDLIESICNSLQNHER